jgi:hypothetical protein
MAVHSSWLYCQSGYFVHKVHCADGLLVYLLAVPYAQSAHCILRLQKSLRSVKVTPSSGLSFLANAWHIGCRGVFWTEWSPFSVVDCSLATPFDRSVRLYSIDPIVRHNHYHIYIYIYLTIYIIIWNHEYLGHGLPNNIDIQRHRQRNAERWSLPLGHREEAMSRTG